MLRRRGSRRCSDEEHGIRVPPLPRHHATGGCLVALAGGVLSFPVVVRESGERC
jgi:hypothetical protein